MASDVRYRLRFLLQELDLRPGRTLLGRSSECHITIEDPLVSRQHARIDVEGGRVTLRDLGSRNGVKVNGAVLHAPVTLTSGDRIRIGTQEFVFTAVEGGVPSNRTTGFLRHCARCRMPYSEEAGACPSCGAHEWLEETLTATTVEQSPGWELALLVEMIDRALARGRVDDADRMLRRASAEVEQQLGRGLPVSEASVAELATGVSRLTVAGQGGPVWACWLVRLFKRLPFAPSEVVRQEIARMLQLHPAEVSDALDELRAQYRGTRPVDGEQFARRHALEQLR